jgi:transposase
MAWVRQLRFPEAAQEHTRLDYLHEVEHMGERVRRLEQAIRETVKSAPKEMQEVIQALQAMRGIAHLSAVTIATELGQVSRFANARELMGYSGLVPSENSTGKRKMRGSITKTGNAHLRRVVVEAAWSYRHRPGIGAELGKRQQGTPEEIKEIAWKAQHRLHKTGRRRQEPSQTDHRSRTRTAGLYLGRRHQDRRTRQTTQGNGSISRKTNPKNEKDR